MIMTRVRIKDAKILFFLFQQPFFYLYDCAVSSVFCSSLVKWVCCYWFGVAAMENSVKVKQSLPWHGLHAISVVIVWKSAVKSH